MICPSEQFSQPESKPNPKKMNAGGIPERFNNPRSQCLSQAMDLITGDRNREYGEPLDNFQRIATGWAVILGHEVTPHKVALCMAWLKIARLCETPGHSDSYVDAAAYAALAFELVHAQGGEG